MLHLLPHPQNRIQGDEDWDFEVAEGCLVRLRGLE